MDNRINIILGIITMHLYNNPKGRTNFMCFIGYNNFDAKGESEIALPSFFIILKIYPCLKFLIKTITGRKI